MAYSSWLTSKFHTYWASSGSGKSDDKLVVHLGPADRARFELSYHAALDYLEDPSLIWDKIPGIEDDDDLHLFLGYIEQFVEDVDQEYDE